MICFFKSLNIRGEPFPNRQWEEMKIDVPWGHVSGKWYGNQDDQPILALHGWLDNAGSFDRLIPLLPQKFPVLCIDLPGNLTSQSDEFNKLYALRTNCVF